ncbi:DNA-binding transcriptional regulator, XRE family [Pasteurella testudinis DSM 23072]|uniref:DNA-binding transcriptional regulator, XRE family n=1 Tax=Pasteurella testudinis DSM 23072 TaxID=1122938 RepID=A0A1W1VA80_9PAST|nr:helix-turn-helix transcriptional regulator [Pasteurella testudinis]SMB90262.1 DNA-binding transcriptional regulator, XRE family [Pasteurella testudinis DSM 23072]SUB51371.1 Predicted transcriptional regulator [Pasteurella testudinis]
MSNFSYEKLWKLLAKKKMKKEDLRLMIGVSSATSARLGKNQVVSMDVLGKICDALNCNIGDIVEYKKGNEKLQVAETGGTYDER